MSTPSTRIDPALGSSSRNIVRPTVDLPQPDSPTRPNVSPALIWNDTPSTARTSPDTREKRPLMIGKCFLRPCTSISGAVALPGAGFTIELDVVTVAGLIAPPAPHASRRPNV